jgi:hypothetical protein
MTSRANRQGDAGRAFLDRDFLQFVEAFGVVQPQYRTRPAGTDLILGFGAGGEIGAADLVELPDLLGQAHPRQDQRSTRAATSRSAAPDAAVPPCFISCMVYCLAFPLEVSI